MSAEAFPEGCRKRPEPLDITEDRPHASELCSREGCGHPWASHEATDDEPGPCWHPQRGQCGCDGFLRGARPQLEVRSHLGPSA